MYYANNYNWPTYANNSGIWGEAHQYRVQWVISSLQDACPTTTTTCTTNERIESVKPLYAYYSDWKLVGITAAEQRGVDVAIIYEDTTETTITNSGNRRKDIQKLSSILDTVFLKIPELPVNNTVTLTNSINQVFDNRNSTSNTYGHEQSATKVMSLHYDTEAESVKVLSETSKVLNTQYCLVMGGVGCTNSVPTTAILGTDCNNSSALKCMPSVLVAKESHNRMATYNTSNGTLAFNSSDPVSEVRSVYGQTFKVDQGTWVPFTDVDRTVEIKRIINDTPMPVAPYPLMTLADTQSMYLRLLQISMIRFWSANTTFFAEGAAKELTYYVKNTQTPVTYAVNANWAQEISDMWNNPSYGIGPIVLDYSASAEAAKINSDKALFASNVSNGISSAWTLATTALQMYSRNNGAFQYNWSSPTDGIGYTAQGVGVTVVTGVLALASTAMTMVAIAAWANPGLFGADTDEQKAALNLRITYASSALKLLSAVITIAFSIKEIRHIARMGVTISKAAGVSTVYNFISKGGSKVGKVAAFMMVIGVLISVGIAWATAYYAIKASKYSYQIGNSVATAIGTTLAVIALAIIGDIPVIGWIISAIIAVVDAVTTAACTAVSAINARKTGYKLLCGGLTGAVTSYFTFYKSSVLVDMDDSYSFNRDVSDVSSFVNTNQGYVQNNSYNYSLNITDSIAKMPIPSAWQSIAYGWQWDNEEIRNTSRAYGLGSSDQDLRWSIDLGTDYFKWVPSTAVVSDTEGSNINYSYDKQTTLHDVQTFTTTGINQKLPVLYLSQSYKVRQQTCFSIPVIFFPLLYTGWFIPVCYMGTFDAKEDSIDVFKDDSITYDIVPPTLSQFMTMRLRSETGRYTFGWNTSASGATDLAFPDFVDADNDGLIANLEITNGTSDNNPDTDADGVNDNQEVVSGTNPIRADSDSDRLTDLQEVQYGTDPNKSDTDGDGLRDGEEIVRSVNGKRVGGWDVTYAIINGVSKVAWFGSDPLNPDSDGDGIIDLRERILGTSPYAKNSPDVVGFENITVNEATQPSALLDFAGPTGPRTITTTDGAKSLPVECNSKVPIFNKTTSGQSILNESQNFAELSSAKYTAKSCVIRNPQITPKFTVAMWVNLSCTANPCLSSNYYFFRSNNINLMTVCPRSQCGATRPAQTQMLSNTFMVNTNESNTNPVWAHIAVVYDGEYYIY
jgi:hypothetical protein